MNSSFEQVSLLSHPASQSSSLNWQQIPTNYPQCKSIHQLFEAQVEQVPDATAVVFENQRLTYKELNKKANQLAHYLQNLGVQPDVLVGICVERSLETVICILAILKAGGAYVPLDPTYPAERIAYSLADAQISILLTTEKHLAKLPVLQGQVVCLDQDWQEIAQQSSENPDSQVQPSNLAYVIYTSGSTGQPKGVLIEHGNVIRLFAATQAWYNFSHNDVWTLFHSYAFDFSVWEIWGALLHGGKLVVVTYLVSRSPDAFYRLLQTEGVTVLNQTPSAFVQLIQVEQSANVAAELNLRLVIFGGEALDLQSLKPWFEGHGDRTPQLVNMYGITETTVHVTYRPLQISDLDSRSSVIGCPIRDLKIHLLDPSLQPVAIGEVGEMYIEGAGLARGYLNREELTRERFISNPFSNDPESKLYKSGDLAKYLPNGDLEYLGRIDHQVKIRGFRIELGEIETVLTSYDEVGQTVAVVREDRPGNKLIIAYVVPRPHCTLQGNTLRQFLQGKLPEYMIPSAFVILESLPLTSNGKIDKRALPAPNFEKSSTEYISPRTAVEEKVAQIWTEVLKLERIGVNDSFFELGGHSLLATQIISRLRTEFKIELQIQNLLEAPTVTQLSDLINSDHSTTKDAIATVIPSQKQTTAPLSYSQEGLWFLDRLEGQNATYNIPLVLRLTGNPNYKCLEKAIDAIIERHEVLRTRFITVEGIGQAEILPAAGIELQLIDLRELSRDLCDLSVIQLAQEEARRSFALTQAPLMRAKLLDVGDNSHILLLTIHHIVADGWSMNIIMNELWTYYRSLTTQTTIELEPLAIQYADFALWQRDHFNNLTLAPQLEYWQHQLAGIPPTLELPLDRPRPAQQTFVGSSQSFHLSQELTKQLQLLSQKSGTTLYMTVLAAFAVLMHRYSRQTDIVIGSPIANRNYREVESLIGFFVNTLALRIDLANQPSFTALLQQVRQVALEAYAHQDAPFSKIVEQLDIERNLRYHPIFQVIFTWQNTPNYNQELEELSVTPIEIESVAAKFDLGVSIVESESGLRGIFTYKTDLFDRATITRMMAHFQTLLEDIVANPQQPIDQLRLLTPAERQKLLVEWNDTATEYPQKCIHQLFEEQVERTPDGVAVVFEQQQITYRELNHRANQLAHHLQSLGVGPEVLVGICVERSLEMVVGLLGILKAGGAYVPLDPSYPNERLSYMLTDSDVEVLLTQESLLESLPQNQAQVVCWDRNWGTIEQLSQENLDVRVNSDNLAYVIYTSGSTGKPKGVAIEHDSILNLAEGLNQAIYVKLKNSPLRISCNGSFSFDTSVKQFIQIIYGHTLDIVSTMVRFDGNALLSYLQDHKIDVFDCTPSQLELLISAGLLLADNVPKCVLVGGEAIASSRWQVLTQVKSINFYNLYGPTECTVDATLCNLRISDNQPLIGRPISNTQIYILDKHLQPLPIGVPGELYIGGNGLARGYLNRPELTGEKFIPNPFSKSQSKRLYKTGDLARYLSDGNIEFLGRIDNQVKIRGFRIELGEIESVFNTHPQIQEAIVIAREDIPGDQRLVAYVVPQSEQPHGSDLRSFLAERLPNYMVPSAFVFLDAMPLTPNGKVDHRALPAPDQSHLQLETNFIPPSNPTEEILVTIWANVLSLKQVGIHDNFFELGGHSLLALRLFSEIEKVFGRTFPLATLFEAPTIRDLANIIAQKQFLAKSPSLVTIQANGSKPPLFLIHAKGSSILIYQELTRHLDSEQPVYGIQPQGLDGKTPVITTVEEMATAYLQEIQKIQPEGPYFLGGYSFGGKLAFEMARQLQQQGQEVAFLALIDCYNNLGSQRLPLSQRLKIHLDNLRQGKHQYLAKKMIAWSSWLNYNLKSKSQKMAFQIVKKIGLPLPLTLLNRYIEENNLQANKNYQPRFYPGKITLFQATEWLAGEGYEIDELLGWQELSGEKVEIYEVPGDHISIFEQPQVKILAEKVSTCLERSQMEKSRSQ
ncbi:MAG: amino acid adenylation domain-containing protein [Xenococcus sp. MO_188.B8]|nr:amino acid adenylation domain-containing protein [Xenococcus sp. MO_188.B8]